MDVSLYCLPLFLVYRTHWPVEWKRDRCVTSRTLGPVVLLYRLFRALAARSAQAERDDESCFFVTRYRLASEATTARRYRRVHICHWVLGHPSVVITLSDEENLFNRGLNTEESDGEANGVIEDFRQADLDTQENVNQGSFSNDDHLTLQKVSQNLRRQSKLRI
ncbi:hypothetical protein EVAR_99145_1 [Eumeta japonica]|uniref:Uncharacterized protein n=1 Tax=Eumeta variegata TaxID=151549 RepID=A0A4C1YB58_EUMVA|nr:hypothetical protein EVAR_99145_1 [Eumeta japonica]